MQCLLLENKICGVLGTGIEQKSYKVQRTKGKEYFDSFNTFSSKQKL